MPKMNVIHHLLVSIRYFHRRIILFAVGVANAGQFWVIMHWFRLDGHLSVYFLVERSDCGLRFYKHMRCYCFNKSIQTWPGNVSKLQLFIVMCYVELVFTCCATFYAATKSHGITLGSFSAVRCCRIWGHFSPFHVLGFGVIFRRSVF